MLAPTLTKVVETTFEGKVDLAKVDVDDVDDVAMDYDVSVLLLDD